MDPSANTYTLVVLFVTLEFNSDVNFDPDFFLRSPCSGKPLVYLPSDINVNMLCNKKIDPSVARGGLRKLID